MTFEQQMIDDDLARDRAEQDSTAFDKRVADRLYYMWSDPAQMLTVMDNALNDGGWLEDFAEQMNKGDYMAASVILLPRIISHANMVAESDEKKFG